jgi:hypothetical protein
MTNLVNPKPTVLAACMIVGVALVLIGSYLIVGEIIFVRNATNFDSSIIEVREEWVQKGEDSVIAYVPVVEITDGPQALKIPVDTFSEEPTYRIGDKMSILCKVSSRRCVRNTLFDKWGDSAVVYLISIAFLVMPLRYLMKSRGTRKHRSVARDGENDDKDGAARLNTSYGRERN